MKMQTIKDLTIVILTNKQDKLLVNALTSSQVAQEVLVLDNYGYDWQTLKKKYHFTVSRETKPIINFAKTRNKALKLVKTKWIMFLDSDETLGTKELLKNNVQAIKEATQQNNIGVSIIRKDIFLNKELKHGEVGRVEIVRLFQTKKTKFHGNIHETITLNTKGYKSNITLLHYSHSDITQFLNSIAKYSKLASINEKTKRNRLTIKMIIYPLGKFISNYFLKLGFLDGYRGLTYAIMMSLHSFFVRVYSFEERNEND